MVVQHNLTAMNANRYLGINNSKLSKSLEKLSSGYAINRAGDNAAGLAVSEKMRSQIAGMTQGVKNAQDGISMVQTFEGALTETDSILQRMKTLADQAANGTYQDDVDRDAIQLEFDQLNDELNQIADTDFNGVVVLNGGQMADGTVAVDGKFDYTLGRTTTVLANEARDLSGKEAHTMADQTNYNKATADAVWGAVGADVEKNQELNVTFMWDGTRWNSKTITDKDGNVVEGANAAKLEARAVERDDATGNGGFEVIAGKNPYTGKDIVATNVIFDEMQGLKVGDTITVQFQNSAAKTYAPKNAGIMEDYTVEPADADSTLTKASFADGKSLKFELDPGINDEAMDATMKKALDDLLAAEFKITLDGTAKKPSDITVADFTIADDGTITADNYDDLKLGKLTFKEPQINSPATAAKNASVSNATITTNTNAANILTEADATKVATAMDGVTADSSKTDTNITITHNNAGYACAALWAGNKTAAEMETLIGIKLDSEIDNADTITFSYTAAKAATPAGEKTDPNAKGDLTFKLNIDAYNYADMSALSVHAVATPKAATMATEVAKDGVSVSNAYKNGAAPLTYTDNITLQTGARSKDAVNFTFKYTSGGMGNLKSNMNCSAREDGLNTASLSLKTAESANYAIDQIDNAINKVSMVRATFGAVQNRLEHKIDNMNVSIENLTSAESQIRDTNMPQEMMNFTKQQILAQASQSMLAQANQLPQSVLSLLQ